MRMPHLCSEFAFVSLVSVAGEWLYRLIPDGISDFGAANAKQISPPITMFCNFFVLLQITEKW